MATAITRPTTVVIAALAATLLWVATLSWAAMGGAGPSAHAAENDGARGIAGACPRPVQQSSPRLVHPPDFPDTDGNVHEEAINCLVSWGVTQGVTSGRDGLYLPGRAVQRDAMASFLARMMRRTDYRFPQRAEDPPRAFPDVAGNVHADNINRLADAGVVEGHADGDYRPAEHVTRAAMASFIVRALETVTGTELGEGQAGEPAFDDTRGSVHEDNITTLAARGVVEGRANGSYAPDQAVRRDAMASFLARSMDYLAEQAHWPVPSGVTLQPPEDTDPANFVHRVRGTVHDQWGQTGEHGLSGVEVRIEVYRADAGGYELVHTERVLSRPGGDVSLAYHADAAPGDQDVVVACPVSADEDPGAQARWCADVRTDGDQASVVPAEDRDAQSVRVSWTEPAAVDAVGAGHYAGSVLAHDPAQGTVEVLTAGGPPPPGEQEGRSERLVRVGYNAADSFVVMSPQAEHHDATVEQFRCVLQAAFDVDDVDYPHLSVEYDPNAPSLYQLSTSVDVSGCFASPAESPAG